MTYRLIAPVAPAIAAMQPLTMPDGTRYAAAVAGTVLDVPDGHVSMLTAAGWVSIAQSGTTAQRPTRPGAALTEAGATRYFDVSLSLLIAFDGATWRNPATGAAV